MALHRQHRFPWAATVVLCVAFSFFGFVGANWPVQGAIRAASSAASRCGERPTLTAMKPKAIQPKPKPTVRYAVVKEGDNLWTIAQRELGDGSKWESVAKLNKLTQNSVLQPYQRLELPSSSPPTGVPSHERS